MKLQLHNYIFVEISPAFVLARRTSPTSAIGEYSSTAL